LEFQHIKSSQRKLSYRFQLCNLRKAERRDWRFWWAPGPALLLINTGLRAGARPALIAIKPLKRVVLICRGEAPA